MVVVTGGTSLGYSRRHELASKGATVAVDMAREATQTDRSAFTLCVLQGFEGVKKHFMKGVLEPLRSMLLQQKRPAVQDALCKQVRPPSYHVIVETVDVHHSKSVQLFSRLVTIHSAHQRTNMARQPCAQGMTR